MNKKGEEEIISIWNFFILAFVIGMVVLAKVLFNSSGGDIRKEETLILSHRISDCVLEEERIIDEYFDEGFDIFSRCSFESEMFKSDGYFSFSITVFDVINNSKIFGNEELLILCGLGSTKEDFSKCYREKLYVFNDKGEEVAVEIIAASRNKGRDIR